MFDVLHSSAAIQSLMASAEPGRRLPILLRQIDPTRARGLLPRLVIRIYIVLPYWIERMFCCHLSRILPSTTMFLALEWMLLVAISSCRPGADNIWSWSQRYVVQSSIKDINRKLVTSNFKLPEPLPADWCRFRCTEARHRDRSWQENSECPCEMLWYPDENVWLVWLVWFLNDLLYIFGI